MLDGKLINYKELVDILGKLDIASMGEGVHLRGGALFVLMCPNLRATEDLDFFCDTKEILDNFKDTLISKCKSLDISLNVGLGEDYCTTGHTFLELKSGLKVPVLSKERLVYDKLVGLQMCLRDERVIDLLDIYEIITKYGINRQEMLEIPKHMIKDLGPAVSPFTPDRKDFYREKYSELELYSSMLLPYVLTPPPFEKVFEAVKEMYEELYIK